MKQKIDLNSMIALEWDANATTRHNQIKSGIDISYSEVLIPAIIDVLGNYQGKRCIDIGCGSGTVASILTRKASFVVGVDLSKRMVEIARQEVGHLPNIEFAHSSIESFTKAYKGPKFDVGVAHMSLMTAPYLDEVIKAISALLKPKGILVFSMTHPCFWNQYRNLEKERDFKYWQRHAQKAEFIISLAEDALPEPTTHYHRPLQYYVEQLLRNRLIIERLVEPYPPPEVHRLYPHKWRIPRFLIFRCQLM
jgi:2-polyprenyl-3-methyl-5-hydroxy-6-metoxy-1,4-benzoquinol methylase